MLSESVLVRHEEKPDTPVRSVVSRFFRLYVVQKSTSLVGVSILDSK